MAVTYNKFVPLGLNRFSDPTRRVALVPAASIAMPPQDIPAEVKSCKAISDDKERLKCFDGLFGGPSKAQKAPKEKQVKNPAEEKQANWSIDETKSPSDGSSHVVAANLVGDIVLILRCKDQITEAPLFHEIQLPRL